MRNFIYLFIKILFSLIIILFCIYFYLKSDSNNSIPKEKIYKIKIEAKNYPEIPQIFLQIYNQFNKSIDVNKYILNQLTSSNLDENCPSLIVSRISNLFDNNHRFIGNEYVSAMKIESEMNQYECLKYQLNKIDFLNGQIGVFNASQFYFNKELKSLDEREMAILAIMTRNPSLYNPKKINRLKLIEQELIDHGY